MSTRRFGTFEGVFTPCLLSILGVIMYLRLGWVVGQVGFGGALVIIILANAITLATALCMSSVLTNIRIGAGGAYSIITKSLGVEAGGAIGIPLYISQAISVAFYITGFTECWHYVFPEHNALFISVSLWLILLIVTYSSATLAFKIQYVIMGIIGASLLSVFLNHSVEIPRTLSLSNVSSEGFWGVFAVFFPAVTGIMAGASLSGELKDPRKSIPRGTLTAIVVSLVIYIALAYLYSQRVPADILKVNNYIAIDLGLWPKIVIAGIMGATLSSALSTAVGSPRVLLALSKHSIIPFSSVFRHVSPKGEPTRAIIFTFIIALVTILFGSLNQIASLLTMFFLITYGMINLTVFIEQSIGIVSFRPSFKVPRTLSFVGSMSCLIVMFIIDVKFSLVAIGVIVLIYYLLLKRGARIYSPDIRSGALVYLAEMFAKTANHLPYFPKIWKPNVLMVVNDMECFKRVIPFIRHIIFPAGRLSVIKLMTDQEIKEDMDSKMSDELNPLGNEGVFVESSAVLATDKVLSAVVAMQTVKGMFFPPNTFFQILNEESVEDGYTDKVVEAAAKEGLGIVLLGLHNKVGFSQESIINLWIRRESPNINLAILIALQLERNWEGTLRLLQVVDEPSEKKDSFNYLNKLKELMRLSQGVEIEVLTGGFKEALEQAPVADINIFGMQEQLNMGAIRSIYDQVPTSVLFIKDSKYESALA